MRIYDGRDDKIAKPTDHTVSVVSAGTCSYKLDNMTFRKNGRIDWSLYYCVQGTVHFENEELSPGEAFIYPPYSTQKYYVLGDEHTVYLYLHFNGTDIASLLSSLNIEIERPIKADGGADIIERICAVAFNTDARSALKAEYLTLRLMSLISEKAEQQSKKGIMTRVIDNMEHSYFSDYDAGKYSAMFGLSVSRFNHLFKDTVGVSPKSYLISLRIENACRLLESTDLSIGEVAESVGYTDALFFGKLFKSRMGVSPRKYREIHLKEE